MIKQLLLLGVVASVYGQVQDKGTPTTLDERCPQSKGSYLIPHETDRTKFYLCKFGWRSEEPTTCPAGTAFDYKIQVCNWFRGTDSEAVSSGNVGAGKSGADEWFANGCPRDPTIHWLLPHDTECNKFYSCVGGFKIVLECQPGLHFNSELQVCDWPFNAGCQVQSNTAHVAVERKWLDNGCPANFLNQWLLPHEADCSRFYLCRNGEKVALKCHFDLHFNPVSQACDWPQNAGCEA